MNAQYVVCVKKKCGEKHNILRCAKCEMQMEKMHMIKTNIWLSIIIPVYNVESYIVKCLESIVCNVLKCKDKVEVIVINDGSSDDSGRIADSYAAKYDFVQVVHKKNEGVAEARNTGIELAKGEWLYFVDSDDWLTDDALVSMYQCCREYESVDIILFDAVKNIGDREEIWEHFPSDRVWCDKAGIRALQRKVLYHKGMPLAAPWDKIYRKEYLDKNNIRFQKKLKVLDDMVFNVEAFGAADEVVYCKKQIYHYRYVADSITNSYKPDRVEQDRVVWNYLQEYMKTMFDAEKSKNTEAELFLQSYYCRVIKSFSICCRLCFFNPLNEKSLQNKIRKIKEVLTESPYKEAFRLAKLKNIEWKLKIIVLMGRSGMGAGIYLLHCLYMLQRRWEEKKG